MTRSLSTPGRRLAVGSAAVVACLCTTLGTSSMTAAPSQAVPSSSPAQAMPVVVGISNFMHIVADMGRSLAFYQALLPSSANDALKVGAFTMTPIVENLYSAKGLPSRVIGFVRVPQSEVSIGLVEFQNPQAKPIRRRWQDPGARLLILTVRDIDALLPQLTKAQGKVLTPGGQPLSFAADDPRQRVAMVEDPDGYLVELVQPRQLPAEAAAGNVIRADLGITVGDTEKAIGFYGKLLGFDIKKGTSFDRKDLRLRAAGLPAAAELRRSTTQVPGTQVRLELLEFRGVERHVLAPTLADPGGTIMRLKVRDIRGLVSAARAAGVTVTSTDDVVPVPPVNQFMSTLLGPDHLYISPAQDMPPVAR